ncbi:MAG: hypothetical protein KAW41_03925 [Candidatus Diapherotrites archaeon]|nr:hypothetical protein [Candidatus Diapherotrites archaeon]
MRKDALEIVTEMMDYIEKHNDVALSKHRISQETGLRPETVGRYLRVIEEAQRGPKIIEVKTGNRVLYKAHGLLTMPGMGFQYAKQKYFPQPDESAELYAQLLKSGAFSPQNAVKIKQTKEVKQGMQFTHLKKTKDGRVYLTRLGKKIAEGTIELYPGLSD